MCTSNHAKALFSLAKEQNKIDKLHYEFESFKDEIENQSTWIVMMDSPMVPLSEKVKKIDELAYDVLFLSFLKTLAEKSQMSNLPEIYAQWTKLVRSYLKIAHVNVISAHKLTKEMEMKVLKAVEPTFPNHEVSLHLHVDKTLIGGLLIIYQGQALDRTIARELEELYQMI